MSGRIAKLICAPLIASQMLYGMAAFAWSQTAAQAQEPYRIGAWFFPYWNSDSLSTWGPQYWGKVYGKPDAWGGVREFAEGKGTFQVTNPLTHQEIEYNNREPLLGFYDLMQPRIVNAEIQMAASEGLSFFAIYWYVDAVTGEEQQISAPTRLFFSSPLRHEIEIVLAPIIGTDQPKDTITLSTWEHVVVPKLISYMSSDTYYRIGGRPLVIDFAWRFASLADSKVALATLRQQSFRRLGTDPLIISLVPSGATYNDLYYGWKVVGVEGFTCSQPPIRGSPEPYADYVADAIPWMKSTMAPDASRPAADLLYVPCGAIGRDPHPWWVQPLTNEPWVVGVTVGFWQKHLQDIRSFINSHYVRTDNMAILYAWNEWGESAEQIEPSKLNGYKFADAVREAFGLHPRASRPHVPQ